MIFKIGDFVQYVAYEGATPEKGRIKSFSDDTHVFVVYNCNQDWDNYTDYTASRTRIEQLIILKV